MDSDMMEREVMIDELHMVIRKKVQTCKVQKRKMQKRKPQKCKKGSINAMANDEMALNEKNETIESLKESLQSKTDLLMQVSEAKSILETTVEDLKSVNEIKSAKINALQSRISEMNNDTITLNDGSEEKITQKTICFKNNLIKVQQQRISSLKNQNHALKADLDAVRKIGRKYFVEVGALNKQIRMLQKTMDIFGTEVNHKEYELLLNEKDLQIKEYLKGMDMNYMIAATMLHR